MYIFFYTQATRYSLVLLVIDTSFLSSFFSSSSSSSSSSFSSHGPFHLDARGARTKKVYLPVLDSTRFLLSVFWKNCCRSYRLFPLLPPSIAYVELLKCTPFPFWRKERILRNIWNHKLRVGICIHLKPFDVLRIVKISLLFPLFSDAFSPRAWYYRILLVSFRKTYARVVKLLKSKNHNVLLNSSEWAFSHER